MLDIPADVKRAFHGVADLIGVNAAIVRPTDSCKVIEPATSWERLPRKRNKPLPHRDGSPAEWPPTSPSRGPTQWWLGERPRAAPATGECGLVRRIRRPDRRQRSGTPKGHHCARPERTASPEPSRVRGCGVVASGSRCRGGSRPACSRSSLGHRDGDTRSDSDAGDALVGRGRLGAGPVQRLLAV